MNPEQDLILTGGGEGELKAWKIDRDALSEGLRENDSGEVRAFFYAFFFVTSTENLC